MPGAPLISPPGLQSGSVEGVNLKPALRRSLEESAVLRAFVPATPMALPNFLALRNV